MKLLACGCVLGRERCFNCRPGLDIDQETAIAITLARAEMSHNDEIVDLMRENAKLREALQKIVHGYFQETASRLDGGYSLACIARAALNPSPEAPKED